MTWQRFAACRGRTETMFAHANSAASARLCEQCPVITQCTQLATEVRPSAGRWGDGVHDRDPTLPPGIKGRVQAAIFDHLETHGPVVDEDGHALLFFAADMGLKVDSVKAALRALEGRGLLVYQRDQCGTYRIELAA